jgi:hypothetical protein
MDARVISAFTRVFDALLPAHDDSRGWRPQPRGHFGQTKPSDKSATAALRARPQHEGGESAGRGARDEPRSRSRERNLVQSDGCGFSLFSSCSALLSAAKSGEPRDTARAHFSFTSRRLDETRNARLWPAACFSPDIYREKQGRGRRLRRLPQAPRITTSRGVGGARSRD